MALTDIAVKSAKPQDKPYKLTDGDGMYLLVTATGKYWRLDYRYLGKRKTLAIGVYPTITLADARERRYEARKSLANNVDPSESKVSARKEAIRNASITFEVVAREWHQKNTVKWSAKNTVRTLSLFERCIFPFIGKLPIADIKPSELLETIQRIEKRGNIQTAHRAMMNCGQIFRYAMATDRASQDISLVLRGSLTPIVEKHHASIQDPNKIGQLLRDIDAYEGLFVTKCALKLAPLFFVRPGELRQAEWSEFNLDEAEWKIPAEKMKMKSVHIIPLSNQALEIIKELKNHTGHVKYLFPGLRSSDRAMSDNTVNAALRRLGYDKDEMSGHGFRSMASTILHEQGWPHDAIERQLAHADRNKVSAAYNYADYLPKRKEMMQKWADYLDELKDKKTD
jgi:integrase